MAQIHPRVLNLMATYQREIAPFWKEYRSELARLNVAPDHILAKGEGREAYDKLTLQTEAARMQWAERVKGLRQQGVIE
jgi:hypothetical protein